MLEIPESVQEVPQVFRPAMDILRDVAPIGDSHFLGRGRHELHRPLGAFGRFGLGLIGALNCDDRLEQILV